MVTARLVSRTRSSARARPERLEFVSRLFELVAVLVVALLLDLSGHEYSKMRVESGQVQSPFEGFGFPRFRQVHRDNKSQNEQCLLLLVVGYGEEVVECTLTGVAPRLQTSILVKTRFPHGRARARYESTSAFIPDLIILLADPQHSTAKRQQRSQAFSSTVAHASLERQLLAAQTAKAEAEAKLRERQSYIDRLEQDRRFLAEREQAEREEKERERTANAEERVSSCDRRYNLYSNVVHSAEQKKIYVTFERP